MNQTEENRVKARREAQIAAGGMASLEMLVAVYLLLLAFFVVLNSISNQKVAKAGAVMESVNSAFDKKFAPPAQVVDFLRKPDVIAPNDEFVDEIVGLMASVFSLDGGYHTEGGDTVRINIPLETLFSGNSATPRADLSPFVQELTALVLAEQGDQRREVEFVFGSGRNKLSSQPIQSQFMAARRAGNLAQALVALGLPPSSVSTGVGTGPEDVITVQFTVRSAQAVAVSFSDLVGDAS